MKTIMLLASGKETNFYFPARSNLQGYGVIIPKVPNLSYSFYVKAAQNAGCDTIVTCSDEILTAILINTGRQTEGKCTKWAGACIKFKGINWIITNPFSHCVTTHTGGFILKRHVDKHLYGLPYTIPDMTWESISGLSKPETVQNFLHRLDTAMIVAVDIETKRMPVSELALARVEAAGIRTEGIAAYMPINNTGKDVLCAPVMTMCGYYAIWKDEVTGKLTGHGWVLNMNTMDDVYLMRRANLSQAPKVLQNGGYDSTYFLRYGAPLFNWKFDTFHFMHCWYAELKRDLAFLTAWFLPNYEYWKDTMEDDTELYNIKDVYNTAWVMLFMVLEAPEWAKQNFLIEFRKVFPNICMGLEGLKRDEFERERLRNIYQTNLERAESRLNAIVSAGFNPRSHVQVKKLMGALSYQEWSASDKLALKKWAEECSLNTIIVECIEAARANGKAISTYIDATTFCGRLLYELNAGGTTTGRAASKASNLWVGTQIQNQDSDLKSMYIADDGYELFSVDNSQSESRCTAYISEDANLIHTVETARDFHTRNASLFFGIPEDEICKPLYVTVVIDGVELQQPKLNKDGSQAYDKSIRDLSKRVNHGANYNMSEVVLIETMGRKNILEAKSLLQLPATMGVFSVATTLLKSFESAYPDVKGKYYDEVIHEIRTTGLLVTPTGWTRRCLELPSRERGDKLRLNKYVAHLPQSTSVMLIDEALFDFWLEWQINRNCVRLKAQVHDEILAQARPEVRPEAQAALCELMRRPLVVRGRTMIIPNDGGSYGYRWGDL